MTLSGFDHALVAKPFACGGVSVHEESSQPCPVLGLKQAIKYILRMSPFFVKLIRRFLKQSLKMSN